MAGEVLELIAATEKKAREIKKEAEEEGKSLLARVKEEGEKLLAETKEESLRAGEKLQNLGRAETEAEIAKEKVQFDQEKDELINRARQRMDETIQWAMERIVK